MIENDEEIIRKNILKVEAEIAGLWRADNGELWSFSKIEPKDRIGKVSIIPEAIPPYEVIKEYEIIWVNDDNIFMDLIMPSVPKPPDKHQIWITEKYLKIDLSKHQQPPNQQYLLLYKA